MNDKFEKCDIEKTRQNKDCEKMINDENHAMK